MGEYSLPEVNKDHFVRGVFSHTETQVHLALGYTHLDITAATRNNQPDLAPGHQGFNACAVYTYRFIRDVIGD